MDTSQYPESAFLTELNGWMENVFLDNNYSDGFMAHIRGSTGTKAAAAHSVDLLNKVLEIQPSYLVDLMGHFGWGVYGRNPHRIHSHEKHLEFVADLRDALQEFHDRLAPGDCWAYQVKPLADELAAKLYAKWDPS